MQFQEIKTKLLELYIQIQELNRKRDKTGLTEFELIHLSQLVKEHDGFESLIPTAEEEKYRNELGDEYADLWKEHYDLRHSSGIKALKEVRRLKEIEKRLEEIQAKRKK